MAAFASGASENLFPPPTKGAEKFKVNCLVVTVQIAYHGLSRLVR